MAAALVALLLTAALLTPAIVRDREAYLSSIVLWEHMEYTAAEYFAVAAGKTPMVNFSRSTTTCCRCLSRRFEAYRDDLRGIHNVMAALSLIGLMAHTPRWPC
jgi:hypothetical protein